MSRTQPDTNLLHGEDLVRVINQARNASYRRIVDTRRAQALNALMIQSVRKAIREEFIHK